MEEKTESRTFNQAKEKASVALMDAITDSVAEIRASEYHPTEYTAHLRQLAYAYRLVLGGAQPGSIEVSTR
ncbi:hypothetical protein PFZ55_41145 [Streptomyces sp. MS2A]|nr:hypothetical protein [Streptomyces sp. MS2A]